MGKFITVSYTKSPEYACRKDNPSTARRKKTIVITDTGNGVISTQCINLFRC